MTASWLDGTRTTDSEPPPMPPGEKFKQFLKVTWMGSWRVMTLFIGSDRTAGVWWLRALIIGAIFAALLVYVGNRTMRTFPIFKLLWNRWRIPGYRIFPSLGRNRLSEKFSADKYKIKTERRTTTPRRKRAPATYPETLAQNPNGWGYSNPVLRNPPAAKESKEIGYYTGYEPVMLRKVKPEKGRHTYGDPGSGLSSSDFHEDQIRAGQMGETNFYKALAKEGLLDQVASFWSLGIFDEHLNKLDDSDVDCVVFTNNTVFLIDLKMYKQGNLTYYNHGETIFSIDNVNGHQVGSVQTATGQMERARDNFKKAMRSSVWGLDSHNVRTYVVFLPTSRGIGLIDCQWPGQIEALPLPTVLAEIKEDVERYGPYNGRQHSYLLSKLQGLLKE